MISISVLLVVLALVFCVIAIAGKVPLWLSVLLLALERLFAVGLSDEPARPGRSRRRHQTRRHDVRGDRRAHAA
jgi:hypothetical protein